MTVLPHFMSFPVFIQKTPITHLTMLHSNHTQNLIHDLLQNNYESTEKLY